MKKTLKTLALLTAGYTIGETITTWRLLPNPIPFREFLTRYTALQKKLTAENYTKVKNAGDVKSGLRVVKNDFNKHYPL